MVAYKTVRNSILSNLKSFIFCVLAIGVLAGCTSTGPVPEEVDHRKPKGGFFTGDGSFDLFESGTKDDGGLGLAVNGYLWRAGLEVASVLPLAQVDPFGGVILTEWWAEPEYAEKQYKITIYVLGRQLISEYLRVEVHARSFIDGQWLSDTAPEQMRIKLENTILHKAGELRQRAKAYLNP